MKPLAFLRICTKEIFGYLPVCCQDSCASRSGRGKTGLRFGVCKGSGSPGCSERTFGHTGSTGTLCWADPASETICVVLTSLTHLAAQRHPRELAAERVGTCKQRIRLWLQALAYYRQLYELERQAKDFSDGQRLQMRQDLSVPILGQFHTWLEAQRPEVLPKSPMAEALGYALNNWAALVRYTEAGFLAIDNNVAEREMKRIAIGRKNWLTVGSPRGGQTAAVLFSFTSTCQRLGVEPWAYLQDVLTRMPTTPAGQLDDLLPDHWMAARLAQRATPSASTP